MMSSCGRGHSQRLQSEPSDGTALEASSTSMTVTTQTRAASNDLQAPTPTAVRIPSIAVDAVMLPLGLRPDGSINVPSDFSQTGWWVDGPEPGEAGPSVILGHVDNRQGPAVFFELKKLVAGELIHIDRNDGSVITYVVERTEKHAKDSFPTNAVYGPDPHPVLRLVTCGGEFDRTARSYEDNVIVFATLYDQ